MATVSDSLVWQLTSRNNSFLQKRNGRTSRSGTVNFSKDPLNIKSLHSFKYSGLANSKAVNVTLHSDDKKKSGKLLKKSVKKANKPAKSVSSSLLNRCYRRSEAVLAKEGANANYRADLTGDLKAKYAAVYNANQVLKGRKSGFAVKTGRSSAKDDADDEE